MIHSKAACDKKSAPPKKAVPAIMNVVDSASTSISENPPPMAKHMRPTIATPLRSLACSGNRLKTLMRANAKVEGQ